MFRCAAVIVWVTCTVVACTGAETQREEAAAAALSVASLIDSGDYVAAEQAARQHADGVRRATGDQSRESIVATDLVVGALVANGKGSSEEARRLAALAVERRQDWLGARHPDLVPALRNLSQVVGESSNGEAVDLLTRALAIQEAATTPPLELARTLDLLSRALERTDRVDDAILHGRAERRNHATLQDSRAQARSLEVLVWAQQAKGDYDAASGRLARAFELRRPRDEAHLEFVETLSLLSYQEFGRGRFEEAHRAASDAFEGSAADSPPRSSDDGPHVAAAGHGHLRSFWNPIAPVSYCSKRSRWPSEAWV